ncbi:MAG: EbsA family protein [Lactobacillaceae bacterium]
MSKAGVIIKFSFRPSLPLQIIHWSLISILLFIAFIFQLEYTNLNWPTVIFFIFFVIASMIELKRYRIEIIPKTGKIVTYNLYNWFSKEYPFAQIKNVIFYPNYIVVNLLSNESCYWYITHKNLILLKKLFVNANIKVKDMKKSKTFSQFFEERK